MIGDMPRHHMGKSESSISVEIGARPVDDAGDCAGGLRGDRHAAAPARMLVVAEPVDDEDVARPQQAERVVQQRRVLARE